MKRWILAIIAANLVGIVALAFVYPDPMLAPGALIPAHANLANDCFACHAPMQGAVEARCTTCHAVADIGLRTVAGAPVAQSTPMSPFHQGLADTDCMGCHTDHPLASLTPAAQPHVCAYPADPGSRRCLFQVSYGTQRIRSTQGSPRSAAAAIRQTNWAAATFDHTRFFALTGPHDVACTSCHTTANEFSQFTCFSCHEHQEADLIRKHLEEGIRNIDNCVACHRDADGERRRGR